MRGSLKQRYQGSWSIILDLGYDVDPQTGLKRRRQKWITFRGPKRDAQQKMNELLHAVHKQEFVEPSKRTFGEWLEEWLEKAIKPVKRLRTYEAYRNVIVRHLKPDLGLISLQQLKALDLERYYARVREKGLAERTVHQHHTIVHSCLQAAMLDGLVIRNVAKLVKAKPRVKDGQSQVQSQCWEAEEARRFLAAAKSTDPQSAALYALALDSGARKGELCGLA